MRLHDVDSLKKNFRMTPEQFDQLLFLVGPQIEKPDTNFRASIPAKERLALTLRYLASGDLMSSISYAFRIARPTVSKIIKETLRAVTEALQPVVLQSPDASKWLGIAEKFLDTWQFPHCIGAIDGKHVIIQAPSNTGSTYFNYKGTFSIVLLAIADANYNFILVDVGAPGHQSDGGVFQNSSFGKSLALNGLEIPEPTTLPNSHRNMPFVFVGDEAFPLKTYLMRPYPGHKLQASELIFNYRLSRARRCVENAFGIMAARFRVFRRPIAASLETTCNVVTATVCLHNFLKLEENDIPASARSYCPPGFADSETDGILNPGLWRDETSQALHEMNRAGSNMYSKNAATIRNEYKDYFINEGSVAWQSSHVNATGHI